MLSHRSGQPDGDDYDDDYEDCDDKDGDGDGDDDYIVFRRLAGWGLPLYHTGLELYVQENSLRSYPKMTKTKC